ncbi:hypothetical protein Lpp125_10091 [Lacticaseibacillus paracasei subsp. paracasei Lpp125]|nr:hypothetical protein Lpp125_10091 [Lacticaseibacillus paracasei subsp. paracasei Lpp125]
MQVSAPANAFQQERDPPRLETGVQVALGVMARFWHCIQDPYTQVSGVANAFQSKITSLPAAI